MLIVDLDKLHFPFTTARPEYAQGVQDLHKAILKCKVDAIPIEWIVNWLTKQHIPATHTCDDYYAVEMMLEDWEKENENN